MSTIDVTDKVNFGDVDGECIPITKCVCGESFVPWDFIISIYKDDTHTCPKCNRKLYFSMKIQVFEINDQ